jgi:drug/metabolite transporter (DMT)-like permease
MPAMLLLAFMWGLSIPITKIGLQTIPPLTLTALRFAVAVPFLIPFVVSGRRVPWRVLPRFAALGFLGVGIGQVAQTYDIAGTSGGSALPRRMRRRAWSRPVSCRGTS